MASISQAVSQTLATLIKRRGLTKAKVSRRLGHDRTWLSRILRGSRQLTVEQVDAVLGVLDCPAWELWSEVARVLKPPLGPAEVLEFQDPVRLLRAMLGTGEETPANALPLLSELEALGIAPLLEGELFAIHPKAIEIDDLRELNPKVARGEAELWLWNLQARYRRSPSDPQITAQICTALGVWSSTLRACGRTRHAASCLLFALDLHGQNWWSPTYADLLERIALVLRDLGSAEAGIHLLKGALTIYFLASDEFRAGKTLLALGILNQCAGKPLAAERSYKRCLESPGLDDVRRTAATVNLAVVLEQQQRLVEAEQTLKPAFDRLGDLPLLWRASVVGAKARLRERQGDLSMATRILEAGYLASRDVLPATSRLAMFLDLATLLLKTGDGHKILPLAQELLPHLADLEDLPRTRRIVDEFIKVLGSGRNLEASEIQAWRSGLESRKRTLPDR